MIVLWIIKGLLILGLFFVVVFRIWLLSELSICRLFHFINDMEMGWRAVLIIFSLSLLTFPEQGEKLLFLWTLHRCKGFWLMFVLEKNAIQLLQLIWTILCILISINFRVLSAPHIIYCFKLGTDIFCEHSLEWDK